MAMPNDWEDVPPPAAPVHGISDWEDVPKVGEAAASGPAPPISGPDGWSTAAKPMINSTGVGTIMSAFGQGFGEAWGPERLGLSKESTQWLSEKGIFAPKGQTHYENPFQAFNEGVIVNVATALDAGVRGAMGMYRGLQSAGVEAGLPKDIVSIPDAFMGSPHALGEIKKRSGLPRDAPVGPPLAELSRAPPFDAFHGSPYSFDAFSTEHIGKGEGAQSYGHGMYFAENTKVAEGYADKLGGEGNIYQVRINVDPDKMLDLDKRLNEQTPFVQQAVKQAMGIDYHGNFDQALADSKWIDHKNADAKTAVRNGFIAFSDEAVTQRLSDAGIPGSRYFDERSRHDLASLENKLAEVREGIALVEKQTGSNTQQMRLANLRRDEGNIARDVEDARNPTHNFVVFNENDIQITHKNGDPIPTFQDKVAEAKDLGVIGPERPPITEGTPKEVAERVTSMAAEGPKGEKVTQELPDQPNPWRERFDQFVGKVKTPEDAKQLIRDAADQNGEFQAAREGKIPLQQFEALTDAAGVERGSVDLNGVGRLLQNDNQVRNAMQAMLSATENVRNAARDVKTDGSEANLMKLQEAMLRRDTWVEQVVGHRAEWGRTGNVFQEFLQKSKEEGGFTQFLKDQDRSPNKLKKLADAIGDMDGTQAARFLSDANKPTFWDKFRFYWINSLISGLTTHIKYIIANKAYAEYEAAAVTPVAGMVGAVRRGIFGGTEGVYVGEAPAKIWGLIAGTPDAMKAAISAMKTGLQTPLPGELAQSIIPKRNQNVTFQQRPIPGTLGAVIGAPSRGASAIHSFFNFLGYRASIEAQAYRAAAADGLKLSDDAFWQRRATVADAPTVEMMNNAIEDGYRLTFISELGEKGKALSSLVNKIPLVQVVMPFTHIPLNILKRAVEGTPAGFLDSETRAALKGEAGAAKQDMAIARMVVGSAVGVWAVNQVLNDRMTGFGPTEPKERAQWLATGHQPYSIRIGDYWYSFNRFGPLGTMLGLYSNLSEVIPHLKPDAEELTKAIGMTVHSTGRLMEDEVGMQGLAGLMEAINEPDRKGARYVANLAGSLLPYSSMQRQVASAMDPYMRETKSVVDGLRYYIPNQRQGLELKRDWTGLPVANTGYGGDIPYAPGLSAIIKHGNAVADPIALEMQALDLHPAPPQNRIAGVKLPPKIYDAYQSTAGAFTREALTHYVEQPNWHELPTFVREQMFKATIESTRKAAAAATQMQYPQIIQQGVDNRTDKIMGRKPTKLKDPSLIMNGPQGGMGIRG